MADEPCSSPERTAKKQKRTRTRTGCLNCRRKKRKCDEQHPSCGGCARRQESCQWGIKVTFRAENAQTLGDHPSMRVLRRRPRDFEIVDITDQVVRDYHLPAGYVDFESEAEEETMVSSPAYPSMPTPSTRQEEEDMLSQTKTKGTAGHALDQTTLRPSHQENRKPGSGSGPSPSTSSQVTTESAVANLLYFSQGGTTPSCQIPDMTNSSIVAPMDSLSVDPLLHQPAHFDSFDFADHLFTPEGSFDEDGIFLPGSAYHELHSTLRNHLIQEVKSNAPTRPSSVAGSFDDHERPNSSTEPSTRHSPSSDAAQESREISSEHEPPSLSSEQECALWKNWFEEISPWLDKFDNDRHFQHVLPGLARSHNHLRYSMLALSARQRELKDANRATDLSLSLYQEAIHLLLPQLSTRTTPVIASCIVLCVLEMCSCSPKAWRRHLDGCASLMEAVGMTGFDGGLEQALFWCFARMDVCGGLISSVKTLIPTNHWASRVGAGLDADVALFKSAGSFTMWANYAVYLAAQVLDLLAPLAKANPGGLFFDGPRSDLKFRAQWLTLWRHVEEWHALRPAEMCPVMSLASSNTNPFPAIVYSNPAAISGNQTYHTASLLMLQNRPSALRLNPRPKSALWHARQICGISMTNHHHGAWTNSIQPLWIAGRCMSHPAEHKAILELYAKIERESGWSTKWRADDLQEFWGDLADD